MPTNEAGAIGHSLASSIRDIIPTANVPGILAITIDKSKGFATETLPYTTIQGAKWVVANPGTTATYGVAGAGLVLLMTPSSFAAAGLGLAGFGANGIIAESYAAAIHSSIGSVVSPSMFATLQSAAAGGYGVATVYPIVQVMGGAITSSAGAGLAWVKSKL